MNRLSELLIKGYKSIKDVSIKFTDINILIGENGAGKSNLLSFFNMMRCIREHELQSYVMEQGGINALLYNGRKQTNECYFSIKRERYEFYGRVKAGSADECYFAQQGIYNYIEQTNRYAVDGFSELKDSGIVKETRVLNDIETYHFHDTSSSSPVKAFCSIHDNIELAEDGRNIAAILYRIKMTDQASYDYIVRLVRLAAPYFRDFVLRVNPLNQEIIRLEWKKDGCEIPFSADQLSDGTLRFICMVTLLCQPKEMRNDVICIDEPELGLHPYAITVIAELIKKYAGKRQVITATQSTEFINQFRPEDIIVTENMNGQTSFKRLDTKELQEWMEDYTLGEIWQKNLIGGRP